MTFVFPPFSGSPISSFAIDSDTSRSSSDGDVVTTGVVAVVAERPVPSLAAGTAAESESPVRPDRSATVVLIFRSLAANRACCRSRAFARRSSLARTRALRSPSCRSHVPRRSSNMRQIFSAMATTVSGTSISDSMAAISCPMTSSCQARVRNAKCSTPQPRTAKTRFSLIQCSRS